MFDTFGTSINAPVNNAQRRRSSYYSIGLGSFAESLLSGVQGNGLDFDSKLFDETNFDSSIVDYLPFTSSQWEDNNNNSSSSATQPNLLDINPNVAAVVAPAPRMYDNTAGGDHSYGPSKQNHSMNFNNNSVGNHHPVTPNAAVHLNPNPAMSPRITADATRKRSTGGRKANKVISTIRSNRAKPTKTVYCSETPRKEERVKGYVYQINDERKKWDGRQWRRLCIVEGCCSAARGATEFCIVHGRGEITKTIINNEEIEVLSTADQKNFSAYGIPKNHAPDNNTNNSSHATTSVVSQVKQENGMNSGDTGMEDPGHMKRKSEMSNQEEHSANKRAYMISDNEKSGFGEKTASLRCQFVCAQGNTCPNAVSRSDAQFPYCSSCAQYCQR